MGSVSPLGVGSTEEESAVLWVPDPEQRHGWREQYVYPDPEAPRLIGFRSSAECAEE